jgi:hypothetical protein
MTLTAIFLVFDISNRDSPWISGAVPRPWSYRPLYAVAVNIVADSGGG